MYFCKHSIVKLIIFLILNTFFGLRSFASAELITETKPDGLKLPSGQLMGVGALGRIEPRSRVIRVSHNAGVEGTNLQKLFFQEGDLVRSDDVLGLLADYNKRQAEVNVAKADVKVLEAKLAVEKIAHSYDEKEHVRYQSLIKTATASVSSADQKRLSFQQSQAIITQLQAEIASAKAGLQVAEEDLSKTVIKAPISGTIIKVQARPGERITEKGLLEIADLTQLDVVAEVYEVDLPKVHVGQAAEIQLVGYPTPYKAQVRELGFQVRKNDLNDTDPLADKDNRIIEVRLTLEDKAVADLQHQIYRQVQTRILP